MCLDNRPHPPETDTQQKITGYLPKDDGAKQAFKDADIIVIPAGIPRKYVQDARITNNC
jgi:malate/lactate dehydrogenase